MWRNPYLNLLATAWKYARNEKRRYLNIYGFYVSTDNKHEIVNTDEGTAKWVSLSQIDQINLFPPVAYYLRHSTDASSGQLYSASEWKKAQLVRVLTESRDQNY